jgi:hypothetical protein
VRRPLDAHSAYRASSHRPAITKATSESHRGSATLPARRHRTELRSLTAATCRWTSRSTCRGPADEPAPGPSAAAVVHQTAGQRDAGSRAVARDKRGDAGSHPRDNGRCGGGRGRRRRRLRHRRRPRRDPRVVVAAKPAGGPLADRARLRPILARLRVRRAEIQAVRPHVEGRRFDPSLTTQPLRSVENVPDGTIAINLRAGRRTGSTGSAACPRCCRGVARGGYRARRLVR